MRRQDPRPTESRQRTDPEFSYLYRYTQSVYRYSVITVTNQKIQYRYTFCVYRYSLTAFSHSRHPVSIHVYVYRYSTQTVANRENQYRYTPFVYRYSTRNSEILTDERTKKKVIDFRVLNEISCTDQSPHHIHKT